MTQQKFWTDDLTVLFKNNKGIDFVPCTEMSLEEKMNTMTRLGVVIFLFILPFNPKFGFLFISLFLTAIIILYYYQKNKASPKQKMTKENYTVQSKPMSAQMYRVTYKNDDIKIENNKVVVNSPSAYRFCDDDVILDVNAPNYMSINQRLVGKPNPKTLIPPVMVPPCMDLDYWRANNMVTISSINSQTQEDAYQSGFQVSTCDPTRNEYITPISKMKRSFQKYKPDTKENFQLNFRPNEGGVDTACGYNPSQIYDAALPSNFPSGRCNRDPKMKEYNENLFTQIIEPNVYYRSEVTEPTNANMGISFTQQFEPTTCFYDGESTRITARDPLIIEPNFHEDDDEEKVDVNEYTVYDPRFSGYGTSYRSYIDKVSGQPRFAYDDIDAIRMPNYITRSNIDHLPFADSYGPMQSGGAYGNEFNSKMKALANDAFTRDSIEHRTDIQQRLMRKVNSQAWQQRVSPISTSGQYMGGGMSCR